MQDLDITLLCKVVDNFGDIGVVYRLVRALKEINLQEYNFSSIKIRIIVDNLESFHILEPLVDPNKDFQIVKDLEIYQWDYKGNLEAFRKRQPRVILECFQCGRPEWLDELLFNIKVPDIVNIIMIDYLTAEDYAESFHCLKSLTRSARVQKVNFMPGFTDKTGGLILDKDFMKNLEASKEMFSRPLMSTPKESIEAIFFGYKRDWKPLVQAINEVSKDREGHFTVKVAGGQGFDSFYEALSTESELYFEAQQMDFVPQIEWDKLLCNTPLLFIRGEDSLARACIIGHPFIWHAYPQSEDYQLVKVGALLDRMRGFFGDEFSIIEECFLVYNGKEGNMKESIKKFLLNYDLLREGFKDFGKSLEKNGDLCRHLMTFISKTCNMINTNS